MKRITLADFPDAESFRAAAFPAGVRRRRWSRAAAFLCWGYAVFALGGWFLLRESAERWYPATLLLFSPRWIWALPLLVVVPLTVWARRRLLWLPAATGLFVVFGMLGFCVPWRLAFHRDKPGSQHLKIVTANLHARQVRPETLDAFLATQQPDVVVFQEFANGTAIPSVDRPDWNRRVISGMLLASRWPIHDVRVLNLEQMARDADEMRWSMPPDAAAVACRLDAPGGPVRLVSLHLSSPHRSFDVVKENLSEGGLLLERNSQRRWLESLLVEQYVRHCPEPAIIAGDFNTPSDSPIFNDRWLGMRDAFDDAGFGVGITYDHPRTSLRIDHVLSDPVWTCVACRTSVQLGARSGHHALFADLVR